MDDDKQIKSLNQRIQKAKTTLNPGKDKPPSPVGKAMKIVVEIVAAMAVGVVIGILVDNYFDTQPIFIIIFFLLGSAAGILNVFRVAKSLQKN